MKEKLSEIDLFNEKHDYSSSLKHVLELLSIPKGYALKGVNKRKQNGKEVLVFRYEKVSGENNGLEGEHFSFVIEEESDKILGFTFMDKSLVNDELPSKEKTKEIAKEFLDRIEPGMFEKLDNLWIDKHNELIKVESKDGIEKNDITISGMKYKCYFKEENNY